MRDGTIPHGRRLLADDRARVVVADVATAVAEAAARVVRRGAARRRQRPRPPRPPGQRGALRRAVPAQPCASGSTPGGALVVWSAAREPELADDLRTVFGDAEERGHDVRLQDRDDHYWLYVGRRRSGRGSVGRMSLRPHRAQTRTEHDSMGDVEVPADALWRAQTQRAVDNFPISGRPLPPALDPRPRPDQGRGRPRQRRPRRRHRRAARRDRRRGRRDRRRASTTTSSRSTSSRPARAPAPT